MTSCAPEPLTAREADVLDLVARGLQSKQIAQRLHITPKTVGHHIAHIYLKIGASNRVTATLYAARHGLAHLTLTDQLGITQRSQAPAPQQSARVAFARPLERAEARHARQFHKRLPSSRTESRASASAPDFCRTGHQPP